MKSLPSICRHEGTVLPIFCTTAPLLEALDMHKLHASRAAAGTQQRIFLSFIFFKANTADSRVARSFHGIIIYLLDFFDLVLVWEAILPLRWTEVKLLFFLLVTLRVDSNYGSSVWVLSPLNICCRHTIVIVLPSCGLVLVGILFILVILDFFLVSFRLVNWEERNSYIVWLLQVNIEVYF